MVGEKQKWYLILLVACLTGSLVRLQILLKPFEVILNRFGSDDMFYFSEVARNVATGGGLSFDGIHPTTGVQPFFVLMLLPFANLFQGDIELTTKLILGLVTCVTICMVLALPRVVEDWMPKNGWAVGAIAGCLWILHPKILQVSFEGTEAFVAACAWICSLFFWRRSIETGRYYILGFVMGIGILIRTDHLILAAMLFVFPISSFGKQLTKAIQLLPGIMLTYGSWLVISWMRVGSVFQDSGQVKSMGTLRLFAVEHHLPFDEVSIFSLPLEQLKLRLICGAKYLGYLTHAESKPSIVFIIALIVLTAIIFISMKSGRRTIQDVLPNTFLLCKAIGPGILASCILFVIYLVVLLHFRSWYLIPLFVFEILVLAAVLFDLFGTHLKRGSVLAATVVIMIFSIMHIEAYLSPRRGLEMAYFEGLRSVERLTPAGARIGAFNSGLAGAKYAPERIIVNLDGVVNHSAYNALRKFKLRQYLQDERIQYLFDYNQTIEYFDQIGGGGVMENLKLLKRVDLPDRDKMWLGLWEFNPENQNRN